MISVLIIYPWLALLPAAIFIAAGAAVQSRFAGGVGFAWLFYCFYELAMKYRILCSGECNIRVDLLLFYPLLLIGSVAAVIAIVRKRRRR